MDGKQADVTFRDELAKAPIKHFDSTLETIDRLAQNNKLYIVTNGVTDTQKDVSLNYNLKTYLMVYLYQRKPVIKSQWLSFWLCFEKIGKDKRKSTIIVGDSLTSDVLGGKNAGIATCWFNVRNKKNNSGINPDYEIKSLHELVDLIENE